MARAATGRAVVIEPVLRRPAARVAAAERAPAARLDEAVGLARAIDLDVSQSGIVMLNAVRPATYLGKGKVEEFAPAPSQASEGRRDRVGRGAPRPGC